MLNLYIGYDKDETIAYHVLCHSLLTRATAPISITPLVREHFRPFFTRERGPYDSTDFSITRFLVPYLSRYEGYSVFMDCDFLARADITRIWDDITDDKPAVWVCQHDYIPKLGKKMQGQVQTTYTRKNWSSFMVFNNTKCRALTPDYVNQASGLDLHRFAWIKNEHIGSLPLDWNWLVGEYAPNPDAKLLHYTLGGPWFPNCRDCDHAEDWLYEYRSMTGLNFWPTRSLKETRAYKEPV